MDVLEHTGKMPVPLRFRTGTVREPAGEDARATGTLRGLAACNSRNYRVPADYQSAIRQTNCLRYLRAGYFRSRSF
jgi:hypothetical protein